MPPEPTQRQRATTFAAWLIDLVITVSTALAGALIVALVTPWGFPALAELCVTVAVVTAWARNHVVRCRLQDAWEWATGRAERLERENASLFAENRRLNGEAEVIAEVLREAIAAETSVKDDER